ncbi:MAG: hypothetical protein Q9157_007244, partial [Trypethelium eluteriae]
GRNSGESPFVVDVLPLRPVVLSTQHLELVALAELSPGMAADLALGNTRLPHCSLLVSAHLDLARGIPVPRPGLASYIQLVVHPSGIRVDERKICLRNNLVLIDWWYESDNFVPTYSPVKGM